MLGDLCQYLGEISAIEDRGHLISVFMQNTYNF